MSPPISRTPKRPAFSPGAPVRVSFSVKSKAEGRRILEHLTEERLVAGGALVEAEAMHWLGGELRRQGRKVVSAYTAIGKLPLIRGRLETLCGEDAPLVSQFVLTEERPSVLRWIERNIRR